MDFMHGGDLYDYLYKLNIGGDWITEYSAKFYIASIILGIEAMHRKGIMHKDLKPKNILMDEDGYLKISDFGLAEYYDLDKQHFAYTPGYRAPEMIIF